MRALRNLLVAAAAVFTVAPAVSFAAPPSCFDMCAGPSTCEKSCTVQLGSQTFTTTCRGAGLCGSIGSVHASFSDFVAHAGASSSACSEERQGTWEPGPASIVCRNIKDSYLCTIKGCDWDFETATCF